MWYWWAAASAWTVVIVVLSLLPGSAVGAVGAPVVDKLAHVAMYGALAYLIHLALGRPSPARGLIVVVGCGAFGAALELLQTAVPGRAPSYADALANLVGAASASALCARARMIASSHRSRAQAPADAPRSPGERGRARPEAGGVAPTPHGRREP